MPHFDHSTFPNRLNKLHFWKWGITLDLGRHRWILRLIGKDDEVYSGEF